MYKRRAPKFFLDSAKVKTAVLHIHSGRTRNSPKSAGRAKSLKNKRYEIATKSPLIISSLTFLICSAHLLTEIYSFPHLVAVIQIVTSKIPGTPMLYGLVERLTKFFDFWKIPAVWYRSKIQWKNNLEIVFFEINLFFSELKPAVKKLEH